jgi:hypothetical protein
MSDIFEYLIDYIEENEPTFDVENYSIETIPFAIVDNGLGQEIMKWDFPFPKPSKEDLFKRDLKNHRIKKELKQKEKDLIKNRIEEVKQTIPLQRIEKCLYVRNGELYIVLDGLERKIVLM